MLVLSFQDWEEIRLNMIHFEAIMEAIEAQLHKEKDEEETHDEL